MYYSNTISINKRPNPIPQSVQVSFEPLDRSSQFKVIPGEKRRLISETYRVSDRNARVPISVSPLNMQAGISEVDRHVDFSRTMTKLASLQQKIDSLLPNQGPAVLPLAGVGGHPIKLALRNYSVDGGASKMKDLEKMNLYRFKANQYKETLSLNNKQGEV